MWGVSWGGFNSLQMAARQPPALKAILAMHAAEDLFQDDIHYIDGLFHYDEYELSMDVANAVTRAPDFPTDEKSLVQRRVFDRERLTYEVDDARPEAAAVRGETETDVHLPGRILSWKARMDLVSDRERFHYRLRRELHENGRVIRERTWEETIPRDYQ